MRLESAGPMSPTEFEESLALALTGVSVTDMGADSDVDEALLAVAGSAPGTIARLDVVEAARHAFARMTRPLDEDFDTPNCPACLVRMAPSDAGHTVVWGCPACGLRRF